jgi:glycerol kinase
VSALRTDFGASRLDVPIKRIRVDGGAAENNLLMQYQSDLSDVVIERPADLESTARGAAMLAGVGAGMFRSSSDVLKIVPATRDFEPAMAVRERQQHLDRWRAALARARSTGAETDAH